MSNTITIDNVPDGYELTGEYRAPGVGEYYYSCRADAELNQYASSMARYPILRKLKPPTPPLGYAHMDGGTRRVPVKDDIYMHPSMHHAVRCDGANDSCKLQQKRWILRKAWQAPAWIPKGCWLYQWDSNTWKISKTPPKRDYEGSKFWSGDSWCPAHMLAALHGEIFTPPTHTNCLQI